MLLVCSDIQVLESPLMSVEVIQNAGFSISRPIQVFTKFPGVIPLTHTAGGGNPLPHPSTVRLHSNTGALAPRTRRGTSAPVLECKPWSPPTFQPWLHPCYMQQVFPWAQPSHERKRYLDRFQIFCRAHLGD